VDTATTYTFELVGSVQDGTELMHVHGDLMAEFFPFGGSGGNTLAAP